MSLYDTKNDCLAEAAKLPMRYEKYDIDVLANSYCEAYDNHDERNKNIYMSALLLRFWSKIDKMYQACKDFGFEREDAFTKLYEYIETACQYRAWQDPEKHTNAQACINQVISSRGIPAIIYEANLHKNFRPDLVLDSPIDGEDGDTFGDTVASDDEVKMDPVQDMVQLLIRENKVIEAIIADNIAYNDTFKHTTTTKKSVDDEGNEVKYKETTSEFWAFRLVQQLNTLDEEYTKYFSKRYKVSIEKLAAAMSALQNAGNQKKYKYISAFQTSAKEIFAQ